MKTAPSQNTLSMSRMVTLHFWMQVGIILLAVIIGVGSTAWIVKGLLLKTALEQEITHYWTRYDSDPNAALPDTKNLYGYRWSDRESAPTVARSMNLKRGVHRTMINGVSRHTAYDVKHGQHLFLVFGESNVNRLIWFFGLLPLMLTLAILYSLLWIMNRRAKQTISPVSQLAKRLSKMRTFKGTELTELTPTYTAPFSDIDTFNNIEAFALKKSLTEYHHTQIESLIREQRFSAEIGHELRTPMSVIKTNAQLLDLTHPDTPHVTRIIQSVNQMSLISTSLLAIARQQTITLTDHVCVNTLTERCVTDVRQSFPDDDHTIDVITPDNTSLLLGNETLMYIIFCNLIRNAMQYSQASTLRIEADDTCLTFTDNGVGLPDELLERFNATRDDRIMPYSPSSEGYGIGMVLVKRLSHIHNWGFSVSNNAHSGATITLTFNHT